MHRHSRSLLVLLTLAGALGACSVSDTPVTPKLAPGTLTPALARIKATDSLMFVTETAYSDTAVLLARLTPLAADSSVSAVIGKDGGQITVPGTGSTIIFPKNALAASTTITMTAVAGDAVVLDFQPHGLVFDKPVTIQQDLGFTEAGSNPSLLTDAHGAYFDTSLESAYVPGSGKKQAKIKETQLGYPDVSRGQFRFSIGHFSGYLVSCGRN